MENFCKLYQVPYGEMFRYDGKVYVHVRGNGMYPWIRPVDEEELVAGYIGMEVERVG